MKRREKLNFDLTPLIDVVFILIMFFVVSSTFKQENRAFNLDLPQTAMHKVDLNVKQITVEMTKEQISYQGKMVDLDIIDKKLSTLQLKGQQVVVRIDKDVSYDRVMKLFEKFQKNNITNLVLVTEENRIFDNTDY